MALQACDVVRRQFVYLAYLDDSAKKRRDIDYQVIAGVVIRDTSFAEIEIIMGASIQILLPPEKWEAFTEFKGSDLFGGYNVFEGIDEGRRFLAIQVLLRSLARHSIPVVYGAVDKKALANKYYGSASPSDTCFRICLEGISEWIEIQPTEDPANVASDGPTTTYNSALVIMDDCDDSNLKKLFRSSFRGIRSQLRPPRSNFKTAEFTDTAWRLHDDMYFGSSKDSIGLQLADLCGFFISQHLHKNEKAEPFYKMIEDKIFFSKFEPDPLSIKPPSNGADSRSKAKQDK